MSQRYKCPSCGQDGGVLLFQQVTECDRCRQGHLVAVSFERSWPPGSVGIMGYAHETDRSVALESWRQRALSMDPRELRAVDEKRVKIGGYVIHRPEMLDRLREQGWAYYVALVLTHSPREQPARGPRVVGRVPDFWSGASGSQRWAEGRDVTMILSTKDVPLERTLHVWHPYPYASAPDCSFAKIGETAESLLRQPRLWEDKPAVKRAAEADLHFRNDHVLLVVRR